MLEITLTNSVALYERKSGTFLAWLGDVGGLTDALTLILSPIAAYISALSFSLSITNGMPTAIQSKGPQLAFGGLQEIADQQINDLHEQIKESHCHKLSKIDVINLLNPIRKLQPMKVTIFN